MGTQIPGADVDAVEVSTNMNRYPSLRGKVRSLPGVVSVVSLAGDVDAVAAPVMAQIFAQYTEPGQDVVVDLTDVSLVSAAAMSVLTEFTGRTRRVLVVATGLAAETLNLAVSLTVVGTLTDALGMLGLGLVALPAPRRVDIRRMHTRAYIARTLDVVCRRYGLDSPDAAFAVMSKASQRHNVPLRILAGAVLDIREPTGAHWFPGRLARPAPRLSFTPAGTPASTLAGALDRIRAHTGARLGSAQSVDPFHTGLVLDRQFGFDADFADAFAHVTDGTAASLAYRTRQQTVIADLATDARLRGTDQTVLLTAGARAVQSTPVLTPDGRCLGVMSTHCADADDLPSSAALRHVEAVAEEAGEWLEWYRRTVVFDALEYLHREARDRSG